MTEEMRHEIVQRRQSGMSQRAIADELGITRGAVRRALERVQAQRDGQARPASRPRPRRSIIDPFEPILRELLAKYPNITAERAVQELQARGFTGKYTVVHRRLRLLRPRATPAPVPRFETCEGAQAQMDHGVYDIDFTREGRRRVRNERTAGPRNRCGHRDDGPARGSRNAGGRVNAHPGDSDRVGGPNRRRGRLHRSIGGLPGRRTIPC